MSDAQIKPSSFALIFPVLCTLAGVIVSAGMGYLTSYQSAALASRTSCIQRIDEQEKLLREQAHTFMSAMGDVMVNSTFSTSRDVKDLEKAAGPLIKAGFAITAFAPAELSFISLKVANSMSEGARAAMNQADKEHALSTIGDSFGKWPSTYLKTLDEFNAERAKCG